MDEYVQSQLILAALTIVAHVLAPGGTFVAKVRLCGPPRRLKVPCVPVAQQDARTLYHCHCIQPPRLQVIRVNTQGLNGVPWGLPSPANCHCALKPACLPGPALPCPGLPRA